MGQTGYLSVRSVHPACKWYGRSPPGGAEDARTAIELVHRAVDRGITFFDNCWEYHGGKSEDWVLDFGKFTECRLKTIQTTLKYNGKEGRQQHHFPSVEELA